MSSLSPCHDIYELRKDSANWVGSDMWATKRLSSLKTQHVCVFPCKNLSSLKKLFYTLQHLGKLRESQEALESHDACSTTKKVYRKRTVVFWADANAGCLICSSEDLHTHQQVISFGQMFCISLRNVPKNKWHMAEERE